MLTLGWWEIRQTNWQHYHDNNYSLQKHLNS